MIYTFYPLKILVEVLIAVIFPQQGDGIDFPAVPAARHDGTKRRDKLRSSFLE